jgi:hypothetical protein
LIGDPTKLSDKNRAKGHADVLATMPEHVRALTEASGTVSDHRRLVAFVYLLLRDNMPFGKMGEITRMRITLTPENRSALFGGFDAAVMWGYVERLTDSTDEALRVTILEWVALVFRFSEHADDIPALIDMLPEADDTETIFTNGWLTQYAQYVTDDLCKPPYADART